MVNYLNWVPWSAFNLHLPEKKKARTSGLLRYVGLRGGLVVMRVFLLHLIRERSDLWRLYRWRHYLAFVLFFFGSPANAQNYVSSRQFGESSQEFQTANAIIQKLVRANHLPRFQWAIVENRDEMEHIGRPVWLLAPVIRALRTEPGKLAFVIAHDIARYDLPDKIGNKEVVCADNPLQTMAALGDPKNYLIKSRVECESMPDPIAIKYMAAAGFSPFDASAVVGNVTAGPYLKMEPKWIQDYVAEHPTDKQRADKLRLLVIKFCKSNPAVCHVPAPQ